MADQMLKGKVVVIGAGAKNLGGLISRTFGADGASVVVHYNSDSTKVAAADTVEAVKIAGGDAFAIQGDLTKVSEVVRLFDEAVNHYGHVDIAVIRSARYSKSRSSRPARKNTTACSRSTPRRLTFLFGKQGSG